MNSINNSNESMVSEDSKNVNQVKSLVLLAIESLYDADVHVENLVDVLPVSLVREYEKYVRIREKLKLDQLQHDKLIQLCHKIGHQLSSIGDEFQSLASSHGSYLEDIIKIAGILINASKILMDATNNKI